MNDEKHQGGCQCGAVRFETTGAPKFVSNCHCVSCRKATGAAFSTWVGFEEAQTRWVSAPPSFHASSERVSRGFCAKCGTPLTYAGAQWPGELHFMIGVFDDPKAFTPRNHVFTEDALAWAFNQRDKHDAS